VERAKVPDLDLAIGPGGLNPAGFDPGGLVDAAGGMRSHETVDVLMLQTADGFRIGIILVVKTSRSSSSGLVRMGTLAGVETGSALLFGAAAAIAQVEIGTDERAFRTLEDVSILAQPPKGVEPRGTGNERISWMSEGTERFQAAAY
jgi:hypothetical protein